MRVIFWLIALGIAGLLIRDRWLRMRRKMRGEPEPVQEGPRTITLVVIAIVLVYGLLIGYRIFASE
ncbi:MAG: hypothetical protein PF501_04020 [Salinisphaera sp.]|jgi:uncharacterized iron-regulated membrane protein|nr:hypothetical protein [Salinisphaera sp.]